MRPRRLERRSGGLDRGTFTKVAAKAGSNVTPTNQVAVEMHNGHICSSFLSDVWTLHPFPRCAH